ncbi:ABC transporter permease [Paenibacillus sp. TRM 82003]|uniref:ABC transporter permease n=1 Tax=Kineococcus sp. TRM81007 TaxID=2925831 RepID=UPI001F57A988|nr:ABC transporter permease [Kineococcus sp. TRM81007]MCI2238448.1 ABC transporter permease [Kineococcus sp. TRM81007]MCI3922038.1 ABC transporter permease [Paenibacillus sp. TRM 82003]
MSTTTDAPPRVAALPAAAPARGPLPGSLRRTAALAGAEGRMLRRNRTALFTALALPVGFVALVASVAGARLATPTGAAGAVNLLLGVLLLMVVFYNVLSAAVARREEGVLQRLRTGEAADEEVLTAMAVPSAALTVAIAAVFGVAGAVALDMPLPGRPLLLALAVVLGCAVMALLALVTAAFTRTLESAQITSLPVIAVCGLGAGLFVPADALPGALARVAGFTPLAPVVELVRAGWIGDPSAADVAVWTATLLAWVLLGSLVVRARFRWSPRS